MIANPKRFADIAAALGENVAGMPAVDAAAKGIAAIRKLSKDVGLPAGLIQLGVKEGDLEVMATNAMKDACMLTNPRTATLTQVVGMYKAAMGAPATNGGAATGPYAQLIQLLQSEATTV
jgi:alcohol dehydrogenase